MAKQQGLIALQGTIGNITFYKTKDGFFARGKGGVDAKRIATDPAYARTRENGAEFRRAGKACKTLRSAFRTLILSIKDSYLSSRLVQTMMQVIKADATNGRGQRNIIDGEAKLLKNFEFNGNARLGDAIAAPFTASMDRSTGTIKVDIPPFSPANMLVSPPGATHFKIVTGAAEIDFEADNFVNENAESAALPINANLTEALSLSTSVTPNSTKPLFLAMGVAFFQEVNGTMYSLMNGTNNALALIDVSGMAVTTP